MTAVSDSGTKTVLLVDDEEHLIDFLEQVLQREGFNVMVASNGRQAVDLYKANPELIDIVLMDITMPVMSGTEACKEMLRHEPGVPIVLMSGFPRDVYEGIDHAHFLRKPMHPLEIVRFVKEVYDTSASAQP